MIDFNAILSAALQQAIEGHLMQIRQEYANKMGELSERLAALEAKPAEGGLTREEVREIADEAANVAISSHCHDYDHDQFIDDLSSVDLSDHFDIEDAVNEAVRSMSFEVRVC